MLSLRIVVLSFLPTALLTFALCAMSVWLWRRKVHAAWIGAVWCLVIGSYLFVPAKIELLVNAPVYSAKRGKVLDRQTGLGLPDVFVLAEGDVASHVAGYTRFNPEYRLFTSTDKDGNYYFPPTKEFAKLEGADFWQLLLLGLSTHEWSIAAVLPGYIESQDESSLIPRNSETVLMHSLDKSHREYSKNGGEVVVSPIVLEPYDLSLSQATAYYRRLATAGEYGPSGNHALQYALNVNVVSYLAKRICAQPENSPLASGVVAEIGSFLDSSELRKSFVESKRTRYKRALKKLEPEGFQPYSDEEDFRSAKEYPNFESKNVCTALKDTGLTL